MISKDQAKELCQWCAKQAKEHPVATAVVAAGTFVGGLLFVVGGHIITTGVVAGMMLSSVVGLLMLKVRGSENKILKRAYGAAMDHPLLTDAVVTAGAFMLAPSGITAWIAASTCGVLTSIWLVAEHGTRQIEMQETKTVCVAQ